MDLALLMSNYGVYLLVLLGLSEALALIPAIGANSIVQAALQILKQAVKLLGLEKK